MCIQWTRVLYFSLPQVRRKLQTLTLCFLENGMPTVR